MSAGRSDIPGRLALTPSEAAVTLGVSLDYFNLWIAPELSWVRRSRKKLVAVVEVERWLREAADRTLPDR